MIRLVWCVWGGFLLHILECNYLSVVVRPTYEKPIDTAEDVIERGVEIISIPGRKSMVETLKKSPFPLTRALAEKTYVTEVLTIEFSFKVNQFSFLDSHFKNSNLSLWTGY